MAGSPPCTLVVGVRQVVVAVLLVMVDFLHGRSAPDALLVGVRQVIITILLVVAGPTPGALLVGVRQAGLEFGHVRSSGTTYNLAESLGTTVPS